MKTQLHNIGLAERLVVKNILGEQNSMNRTTLFMIKRIRNKLNLRSLSSDVEYATEIEKNKLLNKGWEEEQVKGIGLTWDALLDDGWHQDDPKKEEIYGLSYNFDKTDARWLLEQIEGKKHWKLDSDDNPVDIEPALAEAIANLIISLEECIGDKKDD